MFIYWILIAIRLSIKLAKWTKQTELEARFYGGALSKATKNLLLQENHRDLETQSNRFSETANSQLPLVYNYLASDWRGLEDSEIRGIVMISRFFRRRRRLKNPRSASFSL